MAVTNADRASDLHLLDINFMQITEQEVSFKIPDLAIKDETLGPPERGIVCRIQWRWEYLSSDNLENSVGEYGSKLLFIAVRKPHKSVTSATISHWMRNLMAESGIDMDQFEPHSARATANFAASNLGVSIKDILKAATWARESTYLRLNHKLIIKDSFGKTILNGRWHFSTLNIHCHVSSLNCHDVDLELLVSQGYEKPEVRL